MTNEPAPIGLRYLGWSGFRVDWPDGTTVFVDPPEAAALPHDREAWIAITHGHPEHVAGAAAHLADPQRMAAARVLASSRVCAHLRHSSRHAGDRFRALDAGGSATLPGLRVQAFAWRHMPLLPPEPSLAVRHAAHLARHPGITLGIVKDGLVGSPPGAMLGFGLIPYEGPRVLVYSEGLHRRTRISEVRAAREQIDADVLLFAVEPEDVEVLPDLVAAIGARVVVPYEAHAEWRESLVMPRADLEQLSRDLASRGIHAHAAASNRPTQVPLSELAA